MPKFPRVVFFAVGTLLVAACSNYTRTASKVRVNSDLNFDRTKSQVIEQADFAVGEWPSEDWWEVFDDGQLSQFIESALVNNPSLLSAEAKVREANQQAYVVRSKLFPQLSSLFNIVWAYLNHGTDALFPTLDRNFQFYNLSLNFDYEFDFWGKNYNQFQAAVGTAKAEEALYYQLRLLVSTSVAFQYYNLQASQIKYQLLTEIVRNRSKLLELISLRKYNRIDNLLNVNQIKQELMILQESLSAVKEDLELEKTLLLTLLGKNPDEEMELTAIWKVERKPFEIPDNIGLNLLVRRPDLTAQLWMVEKSARLINVALSEFLPDVNLGGFVGLDAVTFAQMFKASSILPSLLPYIKLPVYTGGKLSANLKSSIASFESAAYAYNDLLLKAANEVVSGITSLTSANEKLTFQESDVKYAKENYDLVYTRYRHGIDSMITVLQSNENYLWSKYKKVELERVKYQTTIGLIKALGGGFQDEEGEKLLKKYE